MISVFAMPPHFSKTDFHFGGCEAEQERPNLRCLFDALLVGTSTF
jgi:hypothetical protein